MHKWMHACTESGGVEIVKERGKRERRRKIDVRRGFGGWTETSDK
jgi:hypothetical protein